MEMPRIPSSPPQINKLGNSTSRPLWSVMIPAYNALKYIELTIRSVLAQGFGPEEMQIEVIDDASTDGNLKDLVASIGSGRVTYYRHDENRGSVRTFETCINRATGKYVHILHADDLVLDGYYLELTNLFEQFPNAGAAFCRFNYIDENGKSYKVQSPEQPETGILANWLPRIATSNRVQFIAMAVKREVYEQLGSFFGLDYGEDWVMWVRIARHFNVAYTPKLLASYRKHLQSITGNKIASGEYLRDLRTAMTLIQTELPAHTRKGVYTASRRYYANYGLNTGYQLYYSGQRDSAVSASVVEALKMSANTKTLQRAARLYVRLAFRTVKRIFGGK